MDNLYLLDSLPPLLDEMSDPPKQLWARGTLPADPNLKWLTVVGSRACTSYGKQVVRHLIAGLRGQPIVIVSGLAYGIDAEAHRVALDAGLACVAIPGSGLDWNVLYPRANVGLAREILEKGGCLLSEFKPDMKAADYTFPKRDRVMAGIAHATLIIEAKEKSGTLITARMATEYNRELLVVPGSIFSAESAGVHQFLKLGAVPVTEPADVLKALGLASSDPIALELREDLSDTEIQVLRIVASPRSRDEVLEALELPVSEAQVLLSTMEIKGLLVEEFGIVRAA
jgi:DNA processing protein